MTFIKVPLSYKPLKIMLERAFTGQLLNSVDTICNKCVPHSKQTWYICFNLASNQAGMNGQTNCLQTEKPEIAKAHHPSGVSRQVTMYPTLP